MIYLDNAATTAKKPDGVARAVYEAIASGDLGNPSRGAHDYALNAFRVVYRLREAAADLFGVSDPLRIALTANATDGLNRILKGLLQPGDHVITSRAEHNSVLRPLYQLQSQGVSLDLAELDEAARIDLTSLMALHRPETRAVVVTAASNVTGNVTDLKAIGMFCRSRGLLFIVDASQLAGIYPLDLTELGIDVLVTTGHKSLYGPQGTGLVALGRSLPLTPVFAGGSGAHSFDRDHPALMPDVLESGTLNTPGAAGLAAGIDYVIAQGYPVITQRLDALRRSFLEGLSVIPGIRYYGDPWAEIHAPVVGINLGALASAEAAAILNEDYGMAVRPGAHCAPRLHEELGTVSQGIVRFSFSTFNTPAEIQAALGAINEIMKQTGGLS